MEALNWLFRAITEDVLPSIGSVFINGFLYALLGLVAGLVLVAIAQRKGLLKREIRLWTMCTKLYWLYIPVLFMLLGGALGGVRGTHKAADQFIESSAVPLKDYSRSFMGFFIEKLPSLPWEPGKEMNVDKLVTKSMEQAGLISGGMASGIAGALNKAIISYVFGKLGLPDTFNNPTQLYQDLQKADLGNTTDGIIEPMRTYVGAFFWVKYKLVLLMFLPFLLVPAGEFFGHWLYRRGKRTVQGFYQS